MKLPLIPLDKANHFIYGFLIFVIANIFFNNLISFAIVFAFALAKEVIDEIKYRGFDWKDLIITLIPSLILIILNK